MKLFYCLDCKRVYYLDEGTKYLCGRNHAPAVWTDGVKRRFIISERSESNRPPWPIPLVVEERQLIQPDFAECWIDECKHPEDKEYGDFGRHFGYGAPGGRHLGRDEVLSRYGSYVLQPVEP